MIAESEYRIVQRQKANEKSKRRLYSHLVVIPSKFVDVLSFKKGSLVRFTLSNSKVPFLRMEKVEVSE